MDDRTGQLYESREAAVSAGVPQEHIREIRYLGPLRCALCGKPVKARKSTPSKFGSDGRLYRWCKRCWFTRSHRLAEAPEVAQ